MVRRLLSSRKSSVSGRARRPRGRNLRDHPAQHRRGLGLLILELGAQDRGEIADVLGDQEIVLHEALDILHARMFGVAKPHGDLALDVERQPLLGAAGEEMHVAADRPLEVLAAAEQLQLVFVEHAAIDQFFDVMDAVNIFRDPEQRVQVAQAALAVLDVGLDQIARLPAAAVALLALGELGGDELRAGALDHRLVEPRDQLVEQLLVAAQEARFQNARCGSSCPPWPAGCTRRSSAWRGRPSSRGPTGNRGLPRRPTRPTPSACRAAGTTDRCRSRAPSGRGRSRRWRRSPSAPPRPDSPTGRDARRRTRTARG